MKNNFIFAVMLACTFAACNKKNDAEVKPTSTLEVKTVKNLPADPTPATGKFTLYSLKDNAVVANADSATNKWDIGFRSSTIIVNGGAIRTGTGGGYVHTGLFDDLKNIAENQVFSTDESASILAIPTGSGKGWYNYDQTNNWISPIAGKVLVIKTGEGKYAKIEILSYYKDAPSTPSPSAISRYYTFRYVYQPDGSRTF